jgi:hypothetical protein
MAYEIKTRGDKYYVVDTTDNNKIRGGPYDDEDKAEDRRDELDFRQTVRDRLSRMPVAQMSAEEKAAEYDRMMAEKKDPPETDPKIPPKKDETTEPPKTKKSAYWGDSLD